MDIVVRLYMQVAQFTFRLLVGGLRALLHALGEIGRRTSGDVRPRQHDYDGALDDLTAPRKLPPGPGAFPLGRYISPSIGPQGPISLPEGLAFNHTAVVGPTGAGKTSSVAVPWAVAAAEAGFSVLAIDVKGDFLDLVRAQLPDHPAARSCRLRTLDYTRPRESVSWNWLAGMTTERDIENRVVSILGRQSPSMSDPFFYERDCTILRSLLGAVATAPTVSKATATKVTKILRSQDVLAQFVERFRAYPMIDRLDALVGLDAVEYAKAVSGVLTKLDPLASPTVESVTTRDDFHVPDLFHESTIMTVVAKSLDGALARSLSSLFINDVLQHTYARMAHQSGRPLLLILDEVAQIVDRVDIASVISVARQAGVSLMVAVQDVAQVRDENERSIIFSNCMNYISFNGVSQKSATLLSERLGQREVVNSTVGTSPGPHGSQTTYSRTKGVVPVLGLREISSMPYGKHAAVVHSKDLSSAPVLVDFSR